MIKPTITPQQVVDFLNELAKIDNAAVLKLVEHRVECNAALLDHPTVQVMSRTGKDAHGEDVQRYSVGLTGILNGLFGVFDDGPYKGSGCICAVFDESGSKLLRFAVINKYFVDIS